MTWFTAPAYLFARRNRAEGQFIMSKQPNNPAKLTRSPRTGGNHFELLYQFGPEEMEAARQLADASDVITRFHCDDTHPHYSDLENAEFELMFKTADFYEARLKRLLPSLADLIEWVFESNTIEQAQAAAKPVPA